MAAAFIQSMGTCIQLDEKELTVEWLASNTTPIILQTFYLFSAQFCLKYLALFIRLQIISDLNFKSI